MKTLWLALLVGLAGAPTCKADLLHNLQASRLLLGSDWQEPADLPRRFRNHCSFDVTFGRYYCSNHCGSNYQFYYCAPRSFGCCRIGAGYCDWDGLLRCRP
jgi:hypothetical protein